MRLETALQNFVTFKKAEGLKLKTIIGYELHITLFIKSLSDEQAVVGQVRTQYIADFQAKELGRGMKTRTVRARHRALDMFFNWLSDNEDYGNPPSPMRRADGRFKIKPPRLPKHEPRRAKPADLGKLLHSIPTATWVNRRDRALVQLFCDTGIRVGEAASLQVADVDFVAHRLHITDGKGDKYRQVPLSEKAAAELSAYLACRPDLQLAPGGTGANTAEHLFVSAYTHDGDVRGPMGVTGVQQMLKRLCRRYQIKHINPHSIRHHFGLKALNDGIRLESVSELLGHNDPGFTKRIYAPLLTETIEKEYRENWKVE